MKREPTSKTIPSFETSSLARFLVRVLLFGSFLILVNCYWIISAENRVVWELTDFSFFPTVLFTLFALALANLGLRKYAPRLAFSSAELATLYIMVSVATALAGHDIIRQLVPLMGNGYWFATPENDWADTFHAYLPTWLTVPSRDVLRGYYEGAPFWKRSILDAWIRPFAAWTTFVSVLLFVMLCVNIVVRKQWTEHEKLNYPIAQLPIEVFGNSERFFSSPFMWIGFGLAFGIEAMAGLNYLYPFLPSLKMKYDLSPLIVEKPWSGMGGLAVYVYLFAVGLGYIMPLDLSFSLWFFFVLWKVQLVAVTAMGIPLGAGWEGDQRSGAWLAIGLLALWTSRRHIRRVVRDAFRFDGAEDDSDPIHKLAVFGVIVGFAFVLVFCRIAGMSVWVAFVYFLIYFLYVIAMTRMRAELGPPTHELHGVHPDYLMVTFAGSRPIGARNLSVTTLLSWLAYGYRCHPMPHQLEGFKIGTYFRVRTRRLVVAMTVAGVVGAVIAIGFHIVLYYRYRFAVWGVGEFDRLASWITNPRDPDVSNIVRVGIGFVLVVLLAAMKRTFIWWPLYPVGYAVGYGWAMGWLWFSILLGWVAKRVILTAGGIGSYRRFMPLFLGFMLGQFLAGSLWSLIGIVTERNMYTLFP
jgi:hypothetical protein